VVTFIDEIEAETEERWNLTVMYNSMVKLNEQVRNNSTTVVKCLVVTIINRWKNGTAWLLISWMVIV